MKIFYLIITVLLSVMSFGQSVSISSHLGGGQVLMICEDEIVTYYANVSGYSGSYSCINYSWTVSSNGTKVGGSGNSIQIRWNSGTSGTVDVAAFTQHLTMDNGGGFEGPEGPGGPDNNDPCSSEPAFSANDSYIQAIEEKPQGSMSVSTDFTGIMCPGQEAELRVPVLTGDAEFDGWYKNGNKISSTRTTIVTSPGGYIAKAVLNANACDDQTISKSVYIQAPPSFNMGEGVGDRTVFAGKPVSGSIKVVNSNAQIDRWRIKRGNGDWETYQTVPSSQSSNLELTYTNEVFNETTQFKARIINYCDSEPAEFLPTITINVVEYIPDYNSITSTSYDNQGMISQSAQYFDNAGKALQSQTWSPEENEVFASETLNDNYDRAVGRTLSAPIGRNELGFKEGFATIGGDAITESHWKGSSPQNVDKSQPNTLGYYYSSNNSSDNGLIPETSYPYAVSNFYEDGSGEQKSSSQPGDFHFLESGKNGIMKILPVKGAELEYYGAIRNKLIGQNSVPDRMIKKVAIDANNNQSILYINEGGNTIASAIGTGGPEETFNKWVKQGESFEVHFSVSNDDSNTYYDLINEKNKSGNKPPGLYRFTNNGSSGTTISYTLAYANFAYNFYDNKGRLIASMTPKGVQTIKDNNGLSGYTADNLPYTTLYTYDFQGRLTSMTEPDAGTTRYKYRKDGQIRYSMNASQSQSVYSYTDYDNLGRPIESGECDCNTLFNDTNPNSPVNGGTRTDWIKTYYDVAMLSSLPVEFTGEFALDQEFVTGAVSSTESEEVQTWYSYNEYGRVTWFLQYYKDLDKYFLIQYTYDFLGNVTKVAFQPQTYGRAVSEAYWHYYTYDKNQRLKTVETSVKPDTEKYLHASYEYYTHGPLKRVVLAEDMQGIDYTYTPQGWLKAINHPVRSNDPGGDGNNGVKEDFFGMSLEYFEGDYARAGNKIGSLDLDDNQVPQQYNGNIRAMVFGEGDESTYNSTYQQAKFYNNPQNLNYNSTLDSDLNKKAEQSITLTDGFNSNGHAVTLQITPDVFASQRIVDMQEGEVYAYTYDEKYQLKKADYTKDGATSNTYDVNIDGYDENGNIQGIDRYSDDPDELRDDFVFNYIPGTNKLESVTHPTDPSKNYINLITYNDIGQVVGIDYGDTERTDFNIEYDVTGKVTQVTGLVSGDTIIQFAYDDRGFRMMKKVGDVEEWYVRDASGQVMAIYHRDMNPATPNFLSQIELPIYGASKLGMAFKNPDHYKYIYELTDHLGSVRAIATKLGAQATASMEMENAQYESQYFDNLPASRQQDAVNAYRGTYTAHTDETRPTGPTVTLRVKKDDLINLDVFVKYAGGSNPNVVSNGIADMLDDHVNDAVVGVEGGNLTAAVTTNLAAVLGGVASANSEPKAYIQYILFNEAFEMVSSDYVPVEDGVNVSGEPGWKHVTLNGSVAEDGYLFAYIVNESDLDVFFDNFSFSIIGARMIRATDYYPFGAVAKVWNNPEQMQRETYRHGYQGQYAEADSTTGWNAFELRMYDPLIGRWLQVDPMRQFASSYVGMGNNPVTRTDPTGGFSPIFSKLGKFLGVDSEGYSGKVIVMDEGIYNDLTEGNTILDHSVAESLVGSGGASFLENAALSPEAYSAVLTHVTSQTEGITNFDQLHNGSISLYDRNKKNQFNDPVATGRYSAGGNIKNRVTVNMNYKDELSSVETIQSMLGVHEWMSHVIGGTNHDHNERFDAAYGAQMNHPTMEYIKKNQYQLYREIKFRHLNSPHNWKYFK